MRYQNQVQNSLRFTDLIIAIGVGISALSLFVNNKNNSVLDKINSNLTEINRNEVLENINKLANGGSK